MCETKTMKQEVLFNPQLIERYDTTGPRYTSYPTAVQFHEGFDAIAYRRFTNASNAELIPRPLSLYVHLPFCQSLCYYCGCTKKITRNPKHGQAYLKQLFTEIELQGQLFDPDRRVLQLHLGGGTPTFFDNKQLEALMAELGRWFSLLKTGAREYAIEIDPRTVDAGRLRHLQSLGFNRISMGVQDLNPEVQRAIGRNQTEKQTRSLYDYCREEAFTGINFDLIYGLPGQTLDGWKQTIGSVIEMAPDRLAVYSYAHLPANIKHQAKIDAAALPAANIKSALISRARGLLEEAGYAAIGMDHFALPGDELCAASREGRLHRNFMGYTTIADTQTIGIGPSAISFVGNTYTQNEKRLFKYYRALDKAELPTASGLALTHDDLVRRWIIEQLMCNFQLSFEELSDRFEVDFITYFAEEGPQIRELQGDGLLQCSEGGLNVLPLGRNFVRNIAMVFDAYLKKSGREIQYSRTV